MTHPLDPLGPDELRLAARVCLADPRLGAEPRFAWAATREPDKALVRAGAAVPRLAEVVMVDRATSTTRTAVVDLEAGAVTGVSVREGEHASVLFEEWTGASRVLAHATVVEALGRRGLRPGPDGWTQLHLEPWPLGFGDGAWELGSRRLGRVTFFVRDHDADTAWGRPVEGLIVIADRVTGEVVEVIDTPAGEPVVAVPEGPYPIALPEAELRTDLRPLTIHQDDGPSYQLDGWVLRWQRWQMRVEVHPLEGLVLRDITYDDPATERTRSVAWRMSVSEMVVPYGDPSPMHRWRHVFDAGEVGLGKNATPLTLGCDCLGHIDYLDAHLLAEDGSVVTIPHAVCIHEEDNGVLWRHHDSRTATTEVRRRRRLVVSSWTNLGNYDYGFYWRFGQDGSIEVEVCLTGVVLASATDPDAPAPRHAVAVAPGVAAPHHQHLFSFRLDLDVDGPLNRVEEVDLVAPPDDAGIDDPFGTSMITTRTVVSSESHGRRRADPLAARVWEVRNPSVRNGHGEAVGYRVVGSSTPLLLARPGSPVASRAGFATEHLWVSAYDPEELRAAGPFPNQHPGGAGLPAWTAADRPLDGADVVLWLTCGTSHVVRPEDWPVMPAARTGFLLEPVGFFDANPALDVPPQHLVNRSEGGHCHAG